MTEEQRKVRKFYKEMQGWKPETIGCWIGAGSMALFMIIGAAVPLQEMKEAAGEADFVIWIVFLLFGPLAGFLFLRPYTSITETVYTNQPTNVRIIDKLKYLPISLKEIRKMKVLYLLRFYSMILPGCIVLQLLTSAFSYGEMSWKNVLYIVVTAFVWPVVANLPMILAESAMEIPLHNSLLKYGKWFVVLALLLAIAGFLYFPRNLKDMLLQGADEETATILINDVSGEAFRNYELTGEQREALLELLDKHYVRINPIQKSSISEHYVGIYISVAGSDDMMYLYSEEIISMGGMQYLLYGDSFVERFREIFAEE